MAYPSRAMEQQVTSQPCGHILTNINVWSSDGKWLVYDTRSDAAGQNFDGATIEIVNVESREVREVYRSRNGAHCGVATFSPASNRVAFILGPENPTSDWQYSAAHRQGVLVDIEKPNIAIPLDARDIVPPFTPGALRGGSHVHVFDPTGERVSYTYEDHVLAALSCKANIPPQQRSQRNVGISILRQPVDVPSTHFRNHNGVAFSAVVTRTVYQPRPGSDEISRACEEGWVGTNGYLRPDGSRQSLAIAFQGVVTSREGVPVTEVFVVDLPDDLTCPGNQPLEGTPTTLPAPPSGTQQRRLTYTTNCKFPGVQGARHWLRSSFDGTRIALLMRDDDGIVQLWSVSPNGGEPEQLTRNPFDIASAFSWSPDGSLIAYVADNSVFTTCVASGETIRRTEHAGNASTPRPEACVFSPDGKRIAYVRRVANAGGLFNQIFVATILS